jgi:hypothetical protein
VLSLFLVVVGLSAVGIVIVATVAHVAMRRLDLELFEVLTWLGLAEAPADELSARRGVQPSFGNKVLGGRSLYRAR